MRVVCGGRAAEDDLFAQIAAGTLTLTATRRLARTLTHEHDRRQLAAGRRVWSSADVLPLPAWIERCLHDTWPTARLLSEAQARALWECVVRQDRSAHERDLWDEETAAALAMEANDLATAYRLPSWSRLESTPECDAFVRWRERVRARCRDSEWLEPAALTASVAQAFARDVLPVPRAVLLVGFDELRPAEAELFALLRERGSTVMWWQPTRVAGAAAQLYRSVDSTSEALLVASWIRHVWEPGARVGVVVPDLEVQRTTIERVLQAELTPASVLPGASPSPIVDVALGTPLGDEPVVHTALALLSVVSEALSRERVGVLLQSAFWGDAESEALARARLELVSRERAGATVGLDALVAAARRVAPRTAAHLAAIMRTAQSLGADRRLPSDWVRHYTDVLAAGGWPGERTIDGREAQALRAWNEVLQQLASLDAQLGAVSAASVLAYVTRLCAERVFQPESRDAPVQVLGLLDAAVLPFDHLWVMGMHAENVPARPHPSPFLPLSVQRRANLPHASPESELAFARALVDRLTHSVSHLMMSCPETVDGRSVDPSPLVARLPRATPTWSTAPRALTAALRGTGRLEVVPEDPPPALGDDEEPRGGATLLRDQAACPFRAFALHRLAARPLERPAEDVTPKAWGILVHAALKAFWDAIGDARSLAALDDVALAAAIDRAIDPALARLDAALSGWQRALVRERLGVALRTWLTLERMRPAFTVCAHEHETRLALGGLDLALRLDRIDRVEDGGRHVVLDYKTGAADAPSWWGERPGDPQLPLYFLVRDDVLPEVDAVAFARLRPGAYGFAGLAMSDDVLPGLETLADSRGARARGITDWRALLDAWRDTLTRLADEFRAGRADVDPLRSQRWPPTTCDHCPLPVLCRVRDLAPEDPR